jgi:hypothetical protein
MGVIVYGGAMRGRLLALNRIIQFKKGLVDQKRRGFASSFGISGGGRTSSRRRSSNSSMERMVRGYSGRGGLIRTDGAPMPLEAASRQHRERDA